MNKSDLYDLLFDWEHEYRFHNVRRWRFDHANPEHMLAVEYEGGIWTKGRHVRPMGYKNDCDKYNSASLNGWTVLRYTASHTLEQVVNDVVSHHRYALRTQKNLDRIIKSD